MKPSAYEVAGKDSVGNTGKSLTKVKRMSWLVRVLAAVLVILLGCIVYAHIDAWRASRISAGVGMHAEHPGATELVVVAHGYKGGPEKMTNVLRAIEERKPDADIMFMTYPTRTFGNTDPFRLAALIEEAIDRRYRERKYNHIVLCGHSIGALLVRKAYVYGCGNVEDAPTADDRAKTEGAVHDWVAKVDRIVLLAGMNRGWSVEYRPSEINFWDRTITKFGLWIARVSGTAKCIRSFQRGEPFVANLRLQWLAAAEQARAGTNGFHPPAVIQLLGDKDDLVSKEDSQDLAVARDFLRVGVSDTGHASILQMSNEGTALERKRKLQKALGPTNDLAELQRFTTNPATEVDTNVTTVVFVLHGIRDMGEWTSQFKTPLEEGFAKLHEGTNEKMHVHPPGYGYFPMGAFLLWGDRQRNVRWFMDQVTELKARFPNLRHIHFIGHSNGTYILASALEKYQTLNVDRVVFAGSVVRRDFGWSKFKGRVKRVRNYVGSADWVVAFFPKLFELPLFGVINKDLGSAGYNGFQDGFVKDYETLFIRGGHGAALVPANIQSIVTFLLDETKTDVSSLVVKQHPSALDLFSRICWVIWLAIIAVIIFLGWKLPLWIAKPWARAGNIERATSVVWCLRIAYAFSIWLLLNTL